MVSSVAHPGRQASHTLKSAPTALFFFLNLGMAEARRRTLAARLLRGQQAARLLRGWQLPASPCAADWTLAARRASAKKVGRRSGEREHTAPARRRADETCGGGALPWTAGRGRGRGDCGGRLGMMGSRVLAAVSRSARRSEVLGSSIPPRPPSWTLSSLFMTKAGRVASNRTPAHDAMRPSPTTSQGAGACGVWRRPDPATTRPPRAAGAWYKQERFRSGGRHTPAAPARGTGARASPRPPRSLLPCRRKSRVARGGLHAGGAAGPVRVRDRAPTSGGERASVRHPAAQGHYAPHCADRLQPLRAHLRRLPLRARAGRPGRLTSQPAARLRRPERASHAARGALPLRHQHRCLLAGGGAGDLARRRRQRVRVAGARRSADRCCERKADGQPPGPCLRALPTPPPRGHTGLPLRRAYARPCVRCRQVELARELERRGHVISARTSTLAVVLSSRLPDAQRGRPERPSLTRYNLEDTPGGGAAGVAAKIDARDVQAVRGEAAAVPLLGCIGDARGSPAALQTSTPSIVANSARLTARRVSHRRPGPAQQHVAARRISQRKHGPHSLWPSPSASTAGKRPSQRAQQGHPRAFPAQYNGSGTWHGVEGHPRDGADHHRFGGVRWALTLLDHGLQLLHGHFLSQLLREALEVAHWHARQPRGAPPRGRQVWLQRCSGHNPQAIPLFGCPPRHAPDMAPLPPASSSWKARVAASSADMPARRSDTICTKSAKVTSAASSLPRAPNAVSSSALRIPTPSALAATCSEESRRDSSLRCLRTRPPPLPTYFQLAVVDGARPLHVERVEGFPKLGHLVWRKRLQWAPRRLRRASRAACAAFCIGHGALSMRRAPLRVLMLPLGGRLYAGTARWGK
eukprot:scaffold888_cov569-Prasinococcus_capsulatus_cf.AAC.32